MEQLQCSSLAQSVEHAAVNRSVVGSSPTGGVSAMLCRSWDLWSICYFIVLSVKKEKILAGYTKMW